MLIMNLGRGDNNLNERIRKLRKALDLTQQKFADRLYVKRNAVGQWEIGRNELTDAAILSICREFNVNEKWLRTGNGEMFEELTEQQKILKYTGLLLNDKDSVVANAIQTLIVTYEQLDDASKATLEKIALQYINSISRTFSEDSFWSNSTMVFMSCCFLYSSFFICNYLRQLANTRSKPLMYTILLLYINFNCEFQTNVRCIICKIYLFTI